MINIEKNFTFHAPRPDQTSRYTEIRQNAKLTAELIDRLCPESREKSLATH